VVRAAGPLLVLWVGFIGAALATREGRHITLEVLAPGRPGPGQPRAGGLSQLALPWFAPCWLRRDEIHHDEAQIGSRTFLDLPIWIPELIIRSPSP